MEILFEMSDFMKTISFDIETINAFLRMKEKIGLKKDTIVELNCSRLCGQHKKASM